MSEGELLQMEKARKLDITEEIYFDIIAKKTASLIASCCGIGAFSTSKDNEILKQVMIMGEAIGVAFQIKDDLFDYGDNKVGKPTGIDIIEKKMTLPLIHALNLSTPSEKRHILKILNKDKKTKNEIQEIITFVKSKEGIQYAYNKMLEYKKISEEILYSIPTQHSTEYLAALIKFVIERKR